MKPPRCDQCLCRAKYEAGRRLLCEGHAHSYSVTYGATLTPISGDWQGVNRPKKLQPVAEVPGQGNLFAESEADR